jgi:acetyltransferase-like isoleucine patch superfamily enzyme
MIDALLTWLRGLRQLRHPELVHRLGEIQAALRDIEEIRNRNPGARISPDAVIDGWREGTLQLAPGSQVERGVMLSLGDGLNGYGTLAVGERTWIGPYNNFRLAGETAIRIGAGCLVSQFCTIVSANHDFRLGVKIADAPSTAEPHDVTIGDDVWLGAGAIVLPGVSIGDGAVIGAGSVVTRSVAPNEVWAGNPARKIGERT